MAEQEPVGEKQKIPYETVRDALKANGPDHPETKKLFNDWVAQEEAFASEVNGSQAKIVVSMSQGFLLTEAGLVRQALDCYRDALYQARQEKELAFEEMIKAEIEKLEKASYDEDKLLEEAIWARDSRLADAPDEATRNQERALDEEGMIRRFLGNFRGHLPGGYKRAGGVKKLDEEVDAAIERLKMNREEIMKWQDVAPVSKEEDKQWLSIQKALYIEMRRLGYNHYPDLSG